MRKQKPIREIFEPQKAKFITKLNAPIQNAILFACQEHVLDFYNRHYNTRLLYHNYHRIVEIVSIVEDMGKAVELPEDTIEIAQLAAWFHNTGFLKDYNLPVDKSMKIAHDFLELKKYPPDKIDRVIDCINATKIDVHPIKTAEKLLVDAVHAFSYTTNFFEINPLLRLETELVTSKQYSNFEWHQIQLQNLLSTKFYMPYAKVHFEPIIAQNIKTQKDKVSKNKLGKYQMVDDKEGQLIKFQGIERKIPNDAIQTFFRANYRNHINLSAIADNKANIMISVNAILISVLISLLTYKNITDTNPMVLLPVVIFLMTGLTSLIFAVLSIRPKVTSRHKSNTFNLEEAKKNIVFFGNFVNLKLEQYEEAVDAVFRSGELLYGNMVRDLYFLGKVLDKKYRYLTMSYNIFMIGFIATVLTFLIAIFNN